jgi:enoyl-CoA hydratase/carnithine racemase
LFLPVISLIHASTIPPMETEMPLVLRETVGQVAVLTLNRPEVLNALNTAILDELDAAIDQVEASDAQALVLTGAGRAFCSGTDISGKEPHEGTPEEFASARVGRMHALALRLQDLPQPSIAALNGLAYGGGLELALAFTFRIAAPAAALCMVEVTLGLIPSYGGTQTLPRLIGQGRALEMMLTGDPMSAEEALRIGLVNAVDPNPVTAAVAFAELLPDGAGPAQRAIRRAVAHGAHLDLPSALGVERELTLEIARSPAALEAGARFQARKQVKSGA